ncbi:glycoside hydrolase superfamily [Xylariaceae sp. FL0804]|nr:glycoside hydrolase superfamily [Xylariaceae sp. FL0804]
MAYSACVVVALTALLARSAVALRSFPDCQSAPLSSNQVCNTTLDPWSRATALVAAFSHDDKIANTGDSSPGVASLGLPAYEWWNEALHGVASSPGVEFAFGGGNFSYATSFPQPILMSAAFDMPLVRAVAETVSTEARAFSNAGRAGVNFWTPNINPYRDPRWGRGQETPGEDPYLISQCKSTSHDASPIDIMQLIPGLQGGLAANPFYKLTATCKHYAGYDLENWGGNLYLNKGNLRYGFDANITVQDLQDYYLPPFRSCARDANAQSVMCSYNAVNGVPSCTNAWLLRDVLRGLYDFTSEERWVTADCDAVEDVWTNHGYGGSAAGAAADALNAGTDLDCGTFWPQNLPAAYAAGLFNDTALDRTLIRRYASLVRLGFFDPAAGQAYRQLGWEDVATPAAKALALRAAQEGIVLLKNNKTAANATAALPLPSSVKTVAVVGPLATATTQMQGNYYGTAESLTDVVAAFEAAGYAVNTTAGCTVSGSSTSGFAAAVDLARAADATVYVGGIDTSVEAEGMDRTQITWPGVQLDLIQQLATATAAAGGGKKPFAVVQMGTMVDSSALVASDDVPALLWAGYPGQDGGAAVVSVLTGDTAPAGRLPVTQYPGDYVNQVPMTDMDLHPGTGNPGRTYKWYNATPVFPFGYGLHYTTFNMSLPTELPATFSTASLVTNSSLAKTGPVASGNYPDLAGLASVPVSVTNTGKVTSDYVLLAFLKGKYGPAPYPNKSLVAFTRLHDIEPGESATGTLNITLGSVARSDADGGLTLWPGTYQLALDTDDRAVWDFDITGDSVVLEQLPANTQP